jgi:hypothetical protein
VARSIASSDRPRIRLCHRTITNRSITFFSSRRLSTGRRSIAFARIRGRAQPPVNEFRTSSSQVARSHEIRTVRHLPLSHPFVEGLIGTMRREFLDHVLFWNARDLERNLAEFQWYYNAVRSHASLEGHTPLTFAGKQVSNCQFSGSPWGSGPSAVGLQLWGPSSKSPSPPEDDEFETRYQEYVRCPSARRPRTSPPNAS